MLLLKAFLQEYARHIVTKYNKLSYSVHVSTEICICMYIRKYGHRLNTIQKHLHSVDDLSLLNTSMIWYVSLALLIQNPNAAFILYTQQNSTINGTGKACKDRFWIVPSRARRSWRYNSGSVDVLGACGTALRLDASFHCNLKQCLLLLRDSKQDMLKYDEIKSNCIMCDACIASGGCVSIKRIMYFKWFFAIPLCIILWMDVCFVLGKLS